MLLRIERDSAIPIVEQICEQVRYAVALGNLLPSAPLPTIREAARQLSVNANTVAAAYRILEGEGYLRQRKRAGTRVADDPPRESERVAAAFLADELALRAQAAGIPTARLTSALVARDAAEEESPKLRVAALALSPLAAAALAERFTALFGEAAVCTPVTADAYHSVDYHFTLVDPASAALLAPPPRRAGEVAKSGVVYGPDFPAGAD